MKGYVGRSPLADRYMPYSYGGVSEEDGLDVDQDGSISSGRRANESDRASLDPSSHMDIATLRAKLKTNKRWSILDKLEKRHYCRVRSCKDCMRIMNCKCLLATAMLGIFVLCALSFTRAVFSSSNRDSANYDYIVVGGGSAGAVLTTRLVTQPTHTAAAITPLTLCVPAGRRRRKCVVTGGGLGNPIRSGGHRPLRGAAHAVPISRLRAHSRLTGAHT